MSYYKGLWQKSLVWLLVISTFLTIFAGMTGVDWHWKMWFILPFCTFVVYICGKYIISIQLSNSHVLINFRRHVQR